MNAYLCERFFELACDKVDEQGQLNVDDVLLPGAKPFRVKDGQPNALAVHFLLQVMSLESQCLVRRLRQVFLDALLCSLLVVVLGDIADPL